MAVRKTTSRRTPARRKTTAVKRTTRRRRSMGSAFSATALKQGSQTALKGAAGGAVAKILADNLSTQLAPVLGQLAPYSRPITALIGAYVTDRVMKNKELALGMAGAAGAELASVLTGTFSGLSDNGIMPLSDYQVPLAEGAVYESGYSNQFGY